MIDSFHTRREFGAFAAILLSILSATPAAAAEPRPIRIYAAASLIEALPAALESWAGEAALVFAGSATLARQIEQGAEADLFLSADPDWVSHLVRREMIRSFPVAILRNTLVAVAPSINGVEAGAAAVPPFPKGALLAVADVESVPAGRYARAALEQAGDWPTKARLLQTTNVREALAWAVRGEVDFAIVYGSDAASETGVNVVAEFPENPKRPIKYVGAVIEGAAPEANSVLAHLRGADAQAAFARFGFTPIGE